MKYGPDRLLEGLQCLGFAVEKVVLQGGVIFVIIPAYEILAGKFGGRTIGLGLQSTPNFPITVHSAIHVKAEPQLYEPKDTIPQLRNITASALGPEWRYWSKNFCWDREKSARRLMSQINTIFENA
jgi:hypothetical protein